MSGAASKYVRQSPLETRILENARIKGFWRPCKSIPNLGRTGARSLILMNSGFFAVPIAFCVDTFILYLPVAFFFAQDGPRRIVGTCFSIAPGAPWKLMEAIVE